MAKPDFVHVMGLDAKSGKLRFPPLEMFLTKEITSRIERLYKRDIEVLGFTRTSNAQDAVGGLLPSRDGRSNVERTCVICGGDVQQFESFRGKPRRCPVCGSSERQRSFAYAYSEGSLANCDVDLRDRTMLLVSPSSSERRFLGTIQGLQVTTIDVRQAVKPDVVADICHMDEVADESFDYVYASCVLNCVYDLGACLREFRRVLRRDGALLSLEILEADKNTVEFSDVAVITKWYGREAYEKYRIGAYRRFGKLDYSTILSAYFQVSAIDVVDRPSGSLQRWHVCR
jgi:SAM-dependent methyltransferase